MRTLVFPLLLAACVPEFTDDQSLISAPRILAVRSVPAEAPAGMAVRLSALVASPDGLPAAASNLDWSLCLARKPLTELGPVASACIERIGEDTEIHRRLGRGATVQGTVPADACQRFGPLAAPAQAGGVAGRPVDPDLSGGYHQPVIVGSELGTALGSVRIACGTVGMPNAEVIRFTRGYRPNENPEIDRLEIAGDKAIPQGGEKAGVPVRARQRLDLRAVWAACPRQPVCGDGLCTADENQSSCPGDCRDNPRGCTGAESYLWANPDLRVVQARREGIVASWFASSGAFAEEQTGRTETDEDGVDTTNVWIAPDTPGIVHLWIVVRDDRGGVGWGQYVLKVEP
jgi:hypothetical protein